MSKRFGIADIGESETDSGRWEVVDLQTQKRFALFETEEAASAIAQLMNCRESKISSVTCESGRTPEVEQSASGENSLTELRARLLLDLETLTTLIRRQTIAPAHLRGWADMMANDFSKTLRTYAAEVEKGGQDATES